MNQALASDSAGHHLASLQNSCLAIAHTYFQPRTVEAVVLSVNDVPSVQMF